MNVFICTRTNNDTGNTNDELHLLIKEIINEGYVNYKNILLPGKLIRAD
ncbi:MAG: hypothetical protein ABI863_16465 [Ginsengibacter sp.]